jgi:hypothetical protein
VGVDVNEGVRVWVQVRYKLGEPKIERNRSALPELKRSKSGRRKGKRHHGVASSSSAMPRSAH